MPETSPSETFALLHLDPDGKAIKVYGPFSSEREADAFGLAHTPVWTIWPLVSPVQNGHDALPLHRTQANVGVTCSTCDGGGCLDCTDPA